MGTAIVLIILAGVLGLIVRSMYKDKKAGKSLQCGQDCKHCGRHCLDFLARAGYNRDSGKKTENKEE